MKSFYFGGQFNFRYKDFSIENIANDYRSKILGDYNLWLNKPKNDFVITKDNILYVGPFYFTDYKDGEHIVNFESESIKRATDCVFVLSNESAPGTVTEIVQSVLLNKDIHIYYVKKNIPSEEVDTVFKSDLWYPITFVMNNSKSYEIYGFDTYEEAANRCIEVFKKIMK